MGKTRTNRPKGTGGARKNKNGKIEGTAVLHWANGKTKEKSFTRSTQTELNDIRARLKVLEPLDDDVIDVKINLHTDEIILIKNTDVVETKVDKEILVKDYVDYFIWEHRRRGEKGKLIENSTLDAYIDTGKYIKEYLGNKKVKELTFTEIENFINELHKDKSDNTTKKTRDLIQSMMKYAKKDGIVKENVLQDEKINLKQRKGRKEKIIIEREDIEKFITYCKENKYYELLMILFTGTRASELAGMTWDNLDFENKTITIEKEYTRITNYENVSKTKTVRGFKELKSKNSYRTLSLNGKCKDGTDFIEILKQHKEEQKELARANGKEFKETDCIFTTKKYEGLLDDALNDKLKKVLNVIKIKNYKKLTIHDLRHTFCSIAIMSDVRVEEMKELLGHSNIRSNS